MKFLAGLLCLLSGAVVYLLFRTKQLLGFELLNRIGVERWADRLREYAAQVSMPEVIIFSLPGGLWSLGYILIVDWLLGNQTLSTKRIWAAIIPLLGIGSEILQGIGLLPGTFDICDLFFYAVPYIIYLVYK